MNKKLTPVSTWHYIRLVCRSVLFITVLVTYIISRMNGGSTILDIIETAPVLLIIVWSIFMIEMIFRFFPSKLESPGCQKQFRCNYVPTGNTNPVVHDNNATVLVAIVWILLNGAIGWLFMLNAIDEGILLLVSLAYSVCDMICILFFCPFQTWFLKNKCCVSCRIYNWDYAMMFTPLFFVRKIYTWSLLVAAVALMIRWEITVYRFPERFSENTNAYLNCNNCTEKLCSHKKQLKSLWKQIVKEEKLRENRLIQAFEKKR